MRLAVLVILLFSVVLVAACLQRLSVGNNLYKQQYADNLNRLAISSPEDLEECREGACWCMVCSNNTPIFPGRDNLMGGSCYVEKECNAERLAELNNAGETPSAGPLQFMIGTGPTFGDFGISNTYCGIPGSGGRMTMAIQWLVGSDDAPYLLPDSKRSMCFLSKGVMPVFILYSNGTNMNNISRVRHIAQILGTEGKEHYNGLFSQGPVGPTIVVTEMNVDQAYASKVAEQVLAIDEGCRNDRTNNKINCFVAVGVKLGDFKTLDAIMDELGADSNRVDLVAYGIDNRYASTCDGPKIMLEALNFSSYTLYNHTKPSLITHVLFDPGSTNKDGTCTWTESAVIAGYGSMFPTNIQSLQKRGVIGVSAYSFNSTGATMLTNPLNCTNCAVAANAERIKAWFGGCQQFVGYERLGNKDVSDTTQIYFGNESGTVCNANTQLSYLAGFNFQNRDLLNPIPPTQVAQVNFTYSCDACLFDNASKDIKSFFPSLEPKNYREEYCSIYPELNQWSSARNLDPMYMRAIVVTESNFKPCESARVCGPGYDGTTADGYPCFNPGPDADECFYGAYDEMYIPEDTPKLGTAECPTLVNDIVPSGSGSLPKWRWCAFGMTQVITPPYTFWPASLHPDGQNGQYYDIFRRAGISGQASIEAAKACDPKFNPFQPSHAFCLGTAKMEINMRAARQWVADNKALLNWNTDVDTDKTNFFVAYVAANKYSGYWDLQGSMRKGTTEWPIHPRCEADTKFGDCWALGFKNSWQAKPGVLLDAAYCSSSEGQADTERCKNGQPRREPPGYCYGYTDFMEFVRDCELPFMPFGKKDPGRIKMETYIDLMEKCKTSNCPDGKIYFELAGLQVPPSGTPYLTEELLQQQNNP